MTKTLRGGPEACTWLLENPMKELLDSQGDRHRYNPDKESFQLSVGNKEQWQADDDFWILTKALTFQVIEAPQRKTILWEVCERSQRQYLNNTEAAICNATETRLSHLQSQLDELRAGKEG